MSLRYRRFGGLFGDAHFWLDLQNRIESSVTINHRPIGPRTKVERISVKRRTQSGFWNWD